jgi:hypothetical protein
VAGCATKLNLPYQQSPDIRILLTAFSGTFSTLVTGIGFDLFSGSFPLSIIKQDKSMPSFQCRHAPEHRSSNAVRDYILTSFFNLYGIFDVIRPITLTS